MTHSQALKVMGFTEHPTEEQLKKAYRKLSAKYHPDIAGDEYEKQFKLVVQAYKFLKDYQPTSGVSILGGSHVFTHKSIFTVIRKAI